MLLVPGGEEESFPDEYGSEAVGWPSGIGWTRRHVAIQFQVWVALMLIVDLVWS